MKLTCTTNDFLQALQLVSRAISSQQALPILGNVLLEAKAGACRVSATDLELSIVTSFGAEVETEGSITIPVKAALNLAQYATDSSMTLEVVDGTQIRASSTHGKTVLSGELATNYPAIVPVDEQHSFTLDGGPLLEALNLVTFTAARTSLRPVLSGVLLRSTEKGIVLAATDSYRLSEYVLPANVQNVSCIIPVKVLDEVKTALSAKKLKAVTSGAAEKKEEDSQIYISLSSQQIELKVGQTRFLSRLIEGKFPEYHQIIPKEQPTKMFLTTRDLMTNVRRMHYFAKEMNNNLTFHFNNGSANVATPQTQLGKDEATMTGEMEGSESKIALSSSYLLDFLSHIDSEQVLVSVVDSAHPAVFHIPGNDRFLHLIMPLRMQS